MQITVTVPAAACKKTFNATLQSFRKTTKLAGFRDHAKVRARAHAVIDIAYFLQGSAVCVCVDATEIRMRVCRHMQIPDSALYSQIEGGRTSVKQGAVESLLNTALPQVSSIAASTASFALPSALAQAPQAPERMMGGLRHESRRSRNTKGLR